MKNRIFEEEKDPRLLDIAREGATSIFKEEGSILPTLLLEWKMKEENVIVISPLIENGDPVRGLQESYEPILNDVKDKYPEGGLIAVAFVAEAFGFEIDASTPKELKRVVEEKGMRALPDKFKSNLISISYLDKDGLRFARNICKRNEDGTFVVGSWENLSGINNEDSCGRIPRTLKAIFSCNDLY